MGWSNCGTDSKESNKDFTEDEVIKLLFGEIPIKNSSLICDCPKNYGRACKKPDKYKNGGCK